MALTSSLLTLKRALKRKEAPTSELMRVLWLVEAKRRSGDFVKTQSTEFKFSDDFGIASQFAQRILAKQPTLTTARKAPCRANGQPKSEAMDGDVLEQETLACINGVTPP
jgi:hypothetical protein